METQEVTIASLAGEAYHWFETAKRATGDTETGPREDGDPYTRLKDDAPQWLTDLVYSAHGDFPPDDWRYDCIRAALSAIEDNDGDEDAHEFADSHADVYTGELFAWLSSNLQRQGYVDDAVSEFGYDADRGISGQIMLGQYAEASEVYALVYRALEERLEEVESA